MNYKFIIISIFILIAIRIYDDYITRKAFDNVWDDQYLEEILLLIKKTQEVLVRNNIDNFVYCGSLLGVKRHKGLIPWDDDVDMAVFADKNKIESLKAQFNTIGIELVKCKHWYKTCWKKNPHIKQYAWSWPFIDLFLSDKNHDKVFIKQDDRTVVMNVSDTFPTQQVQFNKIYVNTPKNIDAHLNELFGNGYMDTCISSGWNHRYERLNYLFGSLDCSELIN